MKPGLESGVSFPNHTTRTQCSPRSGVHVSSRIVEFKCDLLSSLALLAMLHQVHFFPLGLEIDDFPLQEVHVNFALVKFLEASS
jgi:hypothetical protein